MAVERFATVGDAGFARIVAADGSAAHAMPARLARKDCLPRDLADAVHHLCALHGRRPGVVDHAGVVVSDERFRPWLRVAAASFADERSYLVTLAAAAGPPPSTPGHAASEATMMGQRNAVDMLARSIRPGCAFGAAAALVLDWPVIRGSLDEAARRLGMDIAAPALPAADDTYELLDMLAANSSTARAMTFGMQQLLAQHRGLWDLLEARAGARR
jgi:hypothetical protein